MHNEQRTAVFDNATQIEAYRLQGILQKFPNHFHSYYVLGFVQQGKRQMVCSHGEFLITAGDLVIFNPRMPHSCRPVDDTPLDWRCINIPEEVMKRLTAELTGAPFLPCFSPTVLPQSSLTPQLGDLHQAIMQRQTGPRKQQALHRLLARLLAAYTQSSGAFPQKASAEIRRACDFMEQHYAERISLDRLGRIAGLKKHTLLRHFTSQQGVTPYQYLETIRIASAKKQLEQGASPAEAALSSGFADQSHFTRFFKNFIGLTPKQYQNSFKPPQLWEKETI